jgi:hypothetical protein
MDEEPTAKANTAAMTHPAKRSGMEFLPHFVIGLRAKFSDIQPQVRDVVK